MRSKGKNWAMATLVGACLALGGCSSTSLALQAARAVNPVDAAIVGAGAWAYYTITQMPAWSAKARSLGGEKVEIELEKSMFSEGGDGAASMVFRQTAKRWCAEHGKEAFETLEFVEFYEPRMMGAARKASGEARCQGAPEA